MLLKDAKQQARGPDRPWAILAELQCFTPLTKFMSLQDSPLGVRTQMQFAMKMVTGTCNQIMQQVSTRGMTDEQRRIWQTKLAQTVSLALASKITREQFLQGRDGLVLPCEEIARAFTTAIGADYKTNYSPYERMSDSESEMLIDRLQSVSTLVSAMNDQAAKAGVPVTNQHASMVIEHFDETVADLMKKIPSNESDRRIVQAKLSGIVAAQYARCIQDNKPLDLARQGLGIVTSIVMGEELFAQNTLTASGQEHSAEPARDSMAEMLAPVKPVTTSAKPSAPAVVDEAAEMLKMMSEVDQHQTLGPQSGAGKPPVANAADLDLGDLGFASPAQVTAPPTVTGDVSAEKPAGNSVSPSVFGDFDIDLSDLDVGAASAQKPTVTAPRTASSATAPALAASLPPTKSQAGAAGGLPDFDISL